jgi:HEPN domain-containing protein
MSQMHFDDHAASGNQSQDELERLILEGVSNSENPLHNSETGVPVFRRKHPKYTESYLDEDEDEDAEASQVAKEGDLQGALGLFAEATQDLATAGVELGLGRHFACADFCNQAVEKAAQAVSLLRFGRRSMYDHDLRSLGTTVGAPSDIQDEMAILTPFHPEAFYADTPPEEADEVISAEQAQTYLQHARHILKWARAIVLQ